MVLHSERWTLTDDFHQPQHSDPPPRLVCLGTPLATCALPTGDFYLFTYLRRYRNPTTRRTSTLFYPQVQLRRGKSVCVTASLRPPVPAHGKVCSFSA